MAEEQMSVNDDYPSTTYRGIPLTEIPSLLNHVVNLPNMENVDKEKHSFLIKPFKYDSSNEDREPETENNENHFWDDDHVQMPWSPLNVDKHGKALWPCIQNILIELKKKCESNKAKISDVQKAFDNCNGRKFDISAFEYITTEVYSEDERNHFMSITLPEMVSLAINVDKICGQTPRKLRINSNHSLTLSQRQAAALLSCAFFCLYPSESDKYTSEGYPIDQSINFDGLLQFSTPWKIQKLKCFLHYFQRVTENMPTGVLTFQRTVLADDMRPDWSASDTTLSNVHIDSKGIIEDVHGLLQVDFANMYIGGGVMDEGRVQEEIRFTICPEMLVSILVCEVMQDNECIFLIGCEQFTTYNGYCDTFEMKDSFHDQTKKDNWGRKLCHVVAIDATYFGNPNLQYTINSMDRELIKAYVGFRLPETFEHLNYGIATGNWGCGAFNGDLQLKAIIQLIACSQAKRPLVYLTFNDQNLVKTFWQVYEHLKENQATVGNLASFLQDYPSQYKQLSLFEFILTTPFPIITNV